MVTDNDGTILREYVRKHCAAILFDSAQGTCFDLMHAATIHPEHGRSVRFMQLDGGFTKNFFENLDVPNSGVEDLEQLLESAEVESYSLTRLKSYSVCTSPLLDPFFEKYWPVLLENSHYFQNIFDKEPSLIHGTVDHVIAIVTKKICQEMTVASSMKNQECPMEGILGAAYQVFHFRKSAASNGVMIVEQDLIRSDDDKNLRRFLGVIRCKNMRSLLTGGHRISRPGILTEGEYSMEDHDNLLAHVQAMEGKDRSLNVDRWDKTCLAFARVDPSGKTETQLHDARCPEVPNLKRGNLKHSENYLMTGTQEELSSLYQQIKENGSAKYAGTTVVGLSPAFLVNLDGLLPINFRGQITERVPGAVVRDLDGDLLLFPVEGCDHYGSCVTMYDDDWKVEEFLAQVPESDAKQIKELEAKGFRTIKPLDKETVELGKILMGRHELVSEDDGPADIDDDATKAAQAASLPSLKSVVDDDRPKKQQKTGK